MKKPVARFEHDGIANRSASSGKFPDLLELSRQEAYADRESITVACQGCGGNETCDAVM